MTWVATVVTVAGTAYGAYSSNKAAKKAGRSLDPAIQYAKDNPGAFGYKPDFEAIDYTPLSQVDPGYANTANAAIQGSQQNLPGILKLTQDTNKAITTDSMDRLAMLYPGFQGAFAQQSNNTNAALLGVLPTEDRQAVIARRSEQQSLGGGGFSGQQVAADLGLSRLQLMQQGQNALSNNINLLGAVDPINRRIVPQSMFVDPSQAIQNTIQERQFGAQFAASERDAAFNAAAMPDPQLAGMLNLLAGQAGQQSAAQLAQRSVIGSALTAGAGAYAGAQQNNYMNALLQQTPQATTTQAPQQPVVVGGQQYANASDAANGYTLLSSKPTGLNYDQGSLGTYFPQKK